jgi:hypothetical protein
VRNSAANSWDLSTIYIPPRVVANRFSGPGCPKNTVRAATTDVPVHDRIRIAFPDLPRCI